MKQTISVFAAACSIAILFSGCGGTSKELTEIEVVSGGPQPWLIEWGSVLRQDIAVRLGRGVVLVTYDEDEKQVALLPAHCRIDGTYIEGFGETRPRQTEEIASSADLRAKLGINIVHAEAGFSRGEVWKLDYTVANVRAVDRQVLQNEVPAGCEQATHYVSQAFFGAYTLDTDEGYDAGVSAGVKIGAAEAEAGGGGGRARALTTFDGDVEKCLDLNTPSMDPACRGILKIELAELK